MALSSLRGVQSSDIDKVWHSVLSLMRGVLKEEKDYSTDHIKYFCKQTRMQLWLIGNVDGFVITEISIYPMRKVLVASFGGGKDGKVDWLDVMEDLKKLADAKGCETVRIYGRKGWIKKFKPKKDMAFFDIEVDQ